MRCQGTSDQPATSGGIEQSRALGSRRFGHGPMKRQNPECRALVLRPPQPTSPSAPVRSAHPMLLHDAAPGSPSLLAQTDWIRHAWVRHGDLSNTRLRRHWTVMDETCPGTWFVWTNRLCARFRPLVPLTGQIYLSGKSPGIQSLANLAGKLNRKGARWVSDFSAPNASSSAVTFRA